jgi:hypothetical protein
MFDTRRPSGLCWVQCGRRPQRTVWCGQTQGWVQARRRGAGQEDGRFPLATSWVEGRVSQAERVSSDGPRTESGCCLTVLRASEVSETETSATRESHGQVSPLRGALMVGRCAGARRVLPAVSWCATLASSVRRPTERSAAGSRKKCPEKVLYGPETSLCSYRRARRHGAA